jgi:hypothetical protein
MSPLVRHPRSAARHRSSGVSLVELMVALGVGVVVVMGLTQMLASTNATYAREEQFARLQENGRIAALMLAREMRPNRSLDCMSAVQHEYENSLSVKACDLLDDGCAGDHYLLADRAMGYDNSDDLSDASMLFDLPSAAAGNVADRWVLGDVLVTWGVEPNGTALNGQLAGSAPIALDGKPEGIKVGTLALVSNCFDASVFKVSGPGDDDVSTSIEHEKGDVNQRAELFPPPDGAAYQVPVASPADDSPRWMLYPLVYKVFYICCTSDGELQTGTGRQKCRPDSDNHDPERFRPALCVFDLQAGQSQVLVPDVADLRVTYTGNSDGKPTGAIDFRAEDTSEIHTAHWVTDNNAWAGVRSASVELLMTTEAAHTASAASAPARASWPPGGSNADTLGAGYGADHRLYQRFRFDVAFRSATPWYVTK